MLKKGIVCFLLTALVCALPAFAYANERSAPGGGTITPYFQSITSITFVLKFTGSTANVSVYVMPKAGVTVDYVTVSADLYMVGKSTPVKSWAAAKIYADEYGEFNFMESTKAGSRGTYYFKSTIKSYRGSTLIETVSGESVQVVY